MTTSSIGPGTVLGGRYQLDDLLSDADGARFWRATDTVLARNVAIHALASDDPRAPGLLEAARVSATVVNAHLLRVLDCDDVDGITWVVNEWGDGVSLDRLLDRGSLPASRAAWLAREVAEAIAAAHEQGVAHGRLTPERVLVTEAGAVKLIGFVTDASIDPPAAESPVYGPLDDRERDVIDLAGILYAALVGRWPGVSPSVVPPAPYDGRRPLRPRQVRAGVPRTLDAICERVLRKEASQHVLPIETAFEVAAALTDFVGDSAAVAPLDVPSMYAEPTVTLRGPEPVDGLSPTSDAAAAAAATAAAGAAGAAADGALPEADVTPPVAPLPVPDAARPVVASPSAPLAGLVDPDATQLAPAIPPAATPGEGAVAETGPETGPEAGDEPGGGKHAAPVPVDEEPTTVVPADPDATQVGAALEDSGSATGLHLAPDDRSEDPDATGRVPAVEAAPLAPFEEPPERPLFASATPRERAPAPEWSSPEWSTDPGTSAPASAITSTGPVGPAATGSPAYWPFQEDAPADPHEDYVPSPRRWLRLAALVVAIAVLVGAMVFAFTRGRGSSQQPSGGPTSSSTGTGSTSGSTIKIVSATAFDPQGDGQEHNAQAPLAVDGNPATSWQTSTYFNRADLGGLKAGVGLVLDLGADHRVESVALRLVGQPTGVRIYAAPSGTTSPPADLNGVGEVGHDGSVGTSGTIRLKNPATTRYLVVWLTSLPAVPGGFRGAISEITVAS